MLTPRPKPCALYHTPLGILYQELLLRDCVVHVNRLEWKGQERMERHFFPNLKQLYVTLNIHILLSSRKFSFQCLLLFWFFVFFLIILASISLHFSLTDKHTPIILPQILKALRQNTWESIWSFSFPLVISNTTYAKNWTLV